MSGCDNRQWRERRNGLAIRLINHEVRNCAIRSWTGLTDHQIRQLCWNARPASATKPRRRRGKPPRQAAFFTRNLQLQFETAQLCSAFAAFGLLEQVPQDSLETGLLEYLLLFCDAYETHRQLFPDGARISFERAWFLLELLRRGDEFEVAHCRHCQGIYLCDGCTSRRVCPCCSLKAIR